MPRVSAPETDETRALAQTTWAARFGWLAGGTAGIFAGFVATWLLEVRVLQGRVREAAALAAKISGAVVPLCFLAGALAGFAFGARGGTTRLKLLGYAAGMLLAALAWALLVVTR